MPLPPGTYPIGGPIVLTGEKPAATAALFEAGARWLGPDGPEVVEPDGGGGYRWVVKAGTGGEGEETAAVAGGTVGGGLTPANATAWHAYETSELLQPNHVYEFIMQRGADASNQAPTVSFYGHELLSSIPASTEDAGDGYTPGSEPNHLMLIHGRSTTTGGLTLHVARKARSAGDTTDSLLIHFQSTAYRIHSLVRLPSGRGSAEIPDNSLGYIKALATTAAQKLGWRTKLEATKITAGVTLPPVAEARDGDIVMMTQDVASGLSFVDVSDRSTEVTSALATDIIMVFEIGRGNRRWVRVGNIFEGHRARMAAEAAQEGVGDLNQRTVDLEHRTSDLDTVTDGPGLADAVAGEAGMAIFARGSTVGDGLLDSTRDLVASDLTGYSWLQTVTIGATRQAVIFRIKAGLNPTDFYLEGGGRMEQVRTSDLVLSDSSWGYYFMGGEVSTTLTVKKRGGVIHTRYRGELTGRALEQVEGIVEAHEPDPSVTVDPAVWGRDTSPRTLFLTIHDLMPSDELRAVDKVRLSLQGAFLSDAQDWTVLTGTRVLAFPIPAGTALSNISNNVRVGDEVRGDLRFYATAGGAASSSNEVVGARLAFAMDVVAPGEVPTPGGSTTLVEHPRVFHANALLTVDPNDNTLWHLNFQPNEAGLVPVANSLFTFLWNNQPNRAITRVTMAPRGTPSADATTIGISDRDGGAVIDRFVQGATYLCRFTGSSIIVLTRIRGQAILVDDPANPIEPSAAYQDVLLYRARQLYFADPVHFADPTATYRDFAATDLPSGYTWGGETQVSPSASSVPDNRIIYSIPGGHFLRKITGGGSAWWVAYTPPNWRGIVADQSAADKTVRAVGDVVYFGGKVQVAATYVARTADVWHWVPLPGTDLRTQAGTAATPAVGDRIFFTDENQPGDPLRYVQVRTLAGVMANMAFFEIKADVGASGSRG